MPKHKIKGKIKCRVKVKPVDYYLCAILPVLPERPVGDEDQPDSQRDTGYHQDGQHKILNLQKSTVGFIFKQSIGGTEILQSAVILPFKISQNGQIRVQL